MPEIDLRISVSDFTLAGMNHIRGEMPLAEFLGRWLEIAYGHALEETIKAQRDKTYEALAYVTQGYRHTIAANKITVTMPSNVKPFPGSDVTRPRPA